MLPNLRFVLKQTHLTCFPTGIPFTPQGVEPGKVSAALARYSRDTWVSSFKTLLGVFCNIHICYTWVSCFET